MIAVQTYKDDSIYNLGLAAYIGNIDEIKHIINLWIANINKLDKQSLASVLHYAVFCKDQAKGFQAFKLLVNAGADFNINMNDESTMQLAAERTANLEIINFLLYKGVKTTALNSNGRASVYAAITQLFNKYKYLLIIEKDAPLEVLSNIITLSLYVTYEDKPKKSFTFTKLNEIFNYQETGKLEIKSFFKIEDALVLKPKRSNCLIM